MVIMLQSRDVAINHTLTGTPSSMNWGGELGLAVVHIEAKFSMLLLLVYSFIAFVPFGN